MANQTSWSTIKFKVPAIILWTQYHEVNVLPIDTVTSSELHKQRMDDIQIVCVRGARCTLNETNVVV